MPEAVEPIVFCNGNPTAENLAQLTYSQARSLNLPVVEKAARHGFSAGPV